MHSQVFEGNLLDYDIDSQITFLTLVREHGHLVCLSACVPLPSFGCLPSVPLRFISSLRSDDIVDMDLLA